MDQPNNPSLRRTLDIVPDDMEIKSIPLFRGLHREIGSYFICAIARRARDEEEKEEKKRKNDDDGTTLASQAEGCTRPDLLIVDTPIVCSSSASLSFRPSFRDIFLGSFFVAQVICHRTSSQIARVVSHVHIDIARRWLYKPLYLKVV